MIATTAAFRRGTGVGGLLAGAFMTAMVLALPATAAADLDGGMKAYEARQYPSAFGEFRELALRADPAAEFMLGVMYFYGQGVPRDNGIAAVWFHKSAVQGHPPAQLAFGSLHLRGVGVSPDLEDAYMWLTLAAESNVAGLVQQAIALRDDAARGMTLSQIETARRRAREWRPRRAGITAN